MRSRPDVDSVIGDILRYGVVASSLLSALGLVFLLASHPPGEPQSILQAVTSGYGAPVLNPGALLAGVAGGSPSSLLELSLVLLVATPLARVSASVVMFALGRDGTYVGITALVLAMLVVAIFVVGPAEG